MSKTFALSLRNKNWINSSLPQVLFKANISGMYLAGGFIRALFDRSKVDDFDLFFRDEDALRKFKKYVSSIRAKTVFVCPEGKLTTYVVQTWSGTMIRFLSARKRKLEKIEEYTGPDNQSSGVRVAQRSGGRRALRHHIEESALKADS